MNGSERVAKFKAIAKDVMWGVLALGLVAFIALAIAGSFGGSDSSREQRQGESDYQYNERLQAENEEMYKDCGFRLAC